MDNFQIFLASWFATMAVLSSLRGDNSSILEGMIFLVLMWSIFVFWPKPKKLEITFKIPVCKHLNPQKVNVKTKANKTNG
jgi:hypothetical protein